MKIKGVLNIINSRADMYGNRYWAFTYTDVETGKTVSGNCAHSADSNIRGVEYVFNGNKWPSSNEPRLYVTRQEMKIREFNQYIKDKPYAGCGQEEIAKFIQKELNK